MSLNVSFFTGYGKIGNYTKTQNMKQKWQNRKASGDFTSKETTTVKYDTRSTSDIVRDKIQEEANKIINSYEELLKNDEDSGSRMTEIRNKYMAGGKLTADEMEYVSKNDPKFYQEIKKEQQELKSFEKRLRAAKTKEEAQRVIADEANNALSKVKAVTNDPHISDADKMAVCVAEYRKLVKKQEIFAKFAEKGEYHKLPTEAEKQKAEKEIREAREEELREIGKLEKDDSENLEEDTDFEAALKKIVQEELSKDEGSPDKHFDKSVPGSEKTHAGERVVNLSKKSQSGKKMPSNESDDAKALREALERDVFGKQAKSIVEAENTPEAMKTKRAKQNRGYAKLFEEDVSALEGSSHVWEA